MGKIFSVISWIAVIIVVLSWLTGGMLEAMVLFFLLSGAVSFFLA